MGHGVGQIGFAERDFARFRVRVVDCLRVLEEVVADPGFGAAAATVGAELEVFLVAEGGRPAAVNGAVCEILGDDRVVLEVSRSNLEVNLTAVPLAGRPFTTMATEARRLVAAITRVSLPRYGARAVPIGTLPTLTPDDVGAEALTDVPRYHALESAWDRRRSRPFTLRVGDGHRGLVEARSVALQGAACSWQIHLTVPPDHFCSTFNAAQLATGPALAAAVNSPLPLGRSGWQEGRIPLYERGFGDRQGRRNRARVGFGRGWVSGGPVAAFKESVYGHDVLLPAFFPAGNEPPAGTALPALKELQTHLSTVWSWNRPVYDANGHLRIEFRALPSGPTPLDMAANAAFLVGLTLSLAAGGNDVASRLPFTYAKANFYRAARQGPDALLWWPSGTSAAGPRRHRAADLVRELIPAARTGLETAGVAGEEARMLLDLLDQRVATGRTGAWWQLRARQVLAGRRPDRQDDESRPDSAAAAALGRLRAGELTERYATLSAQGAPVHTWALPAEPREVGDEAEDIPVGQ
ncbi:glutamate--cysteine ligase [Streptomyces sp. NPDC088258]|uniref:glutamate--cysteine ligase n=1 Tax=Streptomyces sp. NPDC088258 TaxID=3365849 RepID=UPI003806E643